MKKLFNNILLVILIIVFILSLLFLGLMLSIHTEIRLSTIINIILLAMVIFSYKDYDIGTDIFPRYVNGQISDERLVELLEERKHK